jgi:protein gp37
MPRRLVQFFGPTGGKNKKRQGRTLDGRTWDEFPNGSRDRAVD